MVITPKIRAFVLAAAAGRRGRAAALSAGYAESSASVAACRLMKRPEVLALIEAAKGGNPPALTPKKPAEARPAPPERSVDRPAVVAAVTERLAREAARAEPGTTPLEYMLSVMIDANADVARRDRMACAAAQYVHAKAGEAGKKGERKAAAERAATGKFAAPKPPPKLVVSNP